MKLKVVPILMQGFDSRLLKAFELFFVNKCDSLFLMSDDCRETPLALIDFDIIHSRIKLEKLIKENPNIIIFALSLIEQRIEMENVYFLKKPINYLELKKELMAVCKSLTMNKPFKKRKNAKKSVVPRYDSGFQSNNATDEKKISTNQDHLISNRISSKKRDVSHSTSAAMALNKQQESHFVGNHPDINLEKPSDILKIVYSSNHRFQRVVMKAIKTAKEKASPIQVICLGVGFVVDPMTEQIYTAVSDSVLRPLCLLEVEQIDSMKKVSRPINGVEILALAGKQGKKLLSSGIDAFIWKVALWTARGKIPKTTDLNTPAYLSEWPNLTRLQNFPHAMRIAAFLVQQPCRLGDIAKNLNIPQRYVFSFFSAANALGLSNISVRKIDAIIQPEVISKKIAPRQFLKKLLGRLIGAPDKAEEMTNEL